MGNRELESVEAKYGERMIEIKVRFFTNDMVEGKGNIRPKHAWENGVIRLKKNDSHGIIPDVVHFNSIMEIPAKIEEVLIKHKIKLHPSRKMDKYIES